MGPEQRCQTTSRTRPSRTRSPAASLSPRAARPATRPLARSRQATSWRAGAAAGGAISAGAPKLGCTGRPLGGAATGALSAGAISAGAPKLECTGRPLGGAAAGVLSAGGIKLESKRGLLDHAAAGAPSAGAIIKLESTGRLSLAQLSRHFGGTVPPPASRWRPCCFGCPPCLVIGVFRRDERRSLSCSSPLHLLCCLRAAHALAAARALRPLLWDRPRWPQRALRPLLWDRPRRAARRALRLRQLLLLHRALGQSARLPLLSTPPARRRGR